MFCVTWTLAMFNHNSLENSAACELAMNVFVRKEVRK